ncbi:S1C family serine protease [Ornithinimicrobium sp. W1665]|uniref:S1C family serine protease n=1 Tax=Ornithinimicrobium sp. W1665 TaxID=3416666 RepID=UPI003CE6AA7E
MTTPHDDLRPHTPTDAASAHRATAGGPGTAPPGGVRDRGGRRWGDVVAASLLSAVLASGGTYAVVQATDAGDPAPAPSTSADAVSAAQDPTSAPEEDGAADGTTVSFAGDQDWAAVASSVTPGVVSIDVVGRQGQGSGSGVVWDTEGHVVTNAHVVGSAEQVQVVLSDGRRYQASVVGQDPSSDLAVLALENAPAGLEPVRVGDDGVLAVGDPVMAIGNPLGLSGTVTTGIVSALDRPVTTQATGTTPGGAPVATEVVTNAIQTSAAINPGNSGGALVNAAGELVGINSSIAALPAAGQSQAGSIGIGFAIPATKVRVIADQLIADGTAEHAFLGVGLRDGAAEIDGAALTGAQVSQVEPGSPAAGAGIEDDDLVVAIDGEQVPSAIALVGQVRERASGEEVELDVVRDGERLQVTVTLATRPDQG